MIGRPPPPAAPRFRSICGPDVPLRSGWSGHCLPILERVLPTLHARKTQDKCQSRRDRGALAPLTLKHQRVPRLRCPPIGAGQPLLDARSECRSVRNGESPSAQGKRGRPARRRLAAPVGPPPGRARPLPTPPPRAVPGHFPLRPSPWWLSPFSRARTTGIPALPRGRSSGLDKGRRPVSCPAIGRPLACPH